MKIYKIEDVVRSADDEAVVIKRKGNTYIKHITREHDIIKEIYDNKGILKGIDVVHKTPDEVEAIYNLENKTVIVIIKDNKGRKYKGIAKCMKEDKFNPIRGYSIAHARAVIKQKEAKIERLSNE